MDTVDKKTVEGIAEDLEKAQKRIKVLEDKIKRLEDSEKEEIVLLNAGQPLYKADNEASGA